ncbi:Leucine-rich repeat protein kinase family protein [Dorcoceras hygrometricum]|uniref:Leucine-rich repeat protein kinase family protein n=1 Tax=Dorcoceras hygrometricum TaxID=472368 RepID=A0A2Z7CA88_9LAMI|nr:Leucine-rich repeat protein kinase family protein [Dorcoceras hygrometricum]
MGALKGLYLSGNKFSGQIPSDYFATMTGLRKVWLSGNMFTGPIPYSLIMLSHLLELHLESNKFSGTIPPFEQAGLTSLDLSNNNLVGEIPSSLSKFDATSFDGNPGLCGENIGRTCNPFMDSSNRHEDTDFWVNGTTRKTALWVLVASSLLLLLMIAGICVLRRRQEEDIDVLEKGNVDDLEYKKKSSVGKKLDFNLSRKGFGSGHRAGSSRRGSGDLVMLNDDKGVFGLADLMKAAAEVLGSGALGSSYKATMANGLTVVVKRIKDVNKMGKDQFHAAMRDLGRLQHKNVLAPLAYHYRKDEKLLVYEFQPNGSLLLLLHGDCGISYPKLNWPDQLKMVKGIARGLEYIHTELSSLQLPHGDLKSSNVVLATDYEPLLTEYGFCSFISSDQAVQELTAYKSPEAISHQQVSPKCDVFSLGVMILEILTGKFPSQYLTNGKGGTDLVQCVSSAVSEGREVDFFDPDIANTTNVIGEMQQLVHIALACTEKDPEQRLDIREAVRWIEEVDAHDEGVCHRGTKALHVLPSLSDGVAHQSPAASKGYHTHGSDTLRISDVGDQSGRISFAFDAT